MSIKLRDLVRKIADSAATSGVEGAGILLCGRLWPFLRPILVPAVQKLVEAGLASDPDSALQAAISESEKIDAQARAVAEAMSVVLEGLSDAQFDLLRGQGKMYADVHAATLARRRQLHWQLLAAWDFSTFWFRARNSSGDAKAVQALRSACAHVGLPSASIDHIVANVCNNPPEQALYDLRATLRSALHPFVAAMAFSGGLLADRPAAALTEWHDYDLSALVFPYLQDISAASDQSSRQVAIEALATALVLQG